MTNLRDRQNYETSFWDWTPYNECFFPTRIKVSDIDGCVERNGVFLILETKRPNVTIPTGQKIMFEHMAQTGFFTIFLIWGYNNKPETIVKINKNGRKEIAECNEEILKSEIKKWFNYANKQKEQSPKVAIEIRKLTNAIIDLGFRIQLEITMERNTSSLSGELIQLLYDFRDLIDTTKIFTR